MKVTPKIFLFGFLLWLSVLIVAMFMFRIRETNQIFFESLISISLTVFTVLYAVILFRKIETNQFRIGLIVGFIWMSISVLLDYPMFSFGPMKMEFSEYLKDIGLTYLMIPIITTGIGIALERK